MRSGSSSKAAQPAGSERRCIARNVSRNAAGIWECCGDLDEHYDRDQPRGVIGELKYSTDDERRNEPDPSRIPFNGNTPGHRLVEAACRNVGYPTAEALRNALVPRWRADHPDPPCTAGTPAEVAERLGMLRARGVCKWMLYPGSRYRDDMQVATMLGQTLALADRQQPPTRTGCQRPLTSGAVAPAPDCKG